MFHRPALEELKNCDYEKLVFNANVPHPTLRVALTPMMECGDWF